MLFMTQINKITIESKAENCVGDFADCESYTSVVSWLFLPRLKKLYGYSPAQINLYIAKTERFAQFAVKNQSRAPLRYPLQKYHCSGLALYSHHYA